MNAIHTTAQLGDALRAARKQPLPMIDRGEGFRRLQGKNSPEMA